MVECGIRNQNNIQYSATANPSISHQDALSLRISFHDPHRVACDVPESLFQVSTADRFSGDLRGRSSTVACCNSRYLLINSLMMLVSGKARSSFVNESSPVWYEGEPPSSIAVIVGVCSWEPWDFHKTTISVLWETTVAFFEAVTRTFLSRVLRIEKGWVMDYLLHFSRGSWARICGGGR
jgi:hypothetical protein